MKQIIIAVDFEGNIQVEAIGYKGALCSKATEAIERALGTVTRKTPKPEYYQQNQQTAKAGQS